MKSYSERLAWAMECCGLDPKRDQTSVAHRVGKPCTPQAIQYLLDPRKNAKSSKYTPQLATVLMCDPMWLATGKGQKPLPRDDISNIGQASSGNDQRVVAEPPVTWYWPWSVSVARLRALPPEVIGRIDGYMESRVEEYERSLLAREAVAAR